MRWTRAVPLAAALWVVVGCAGDESVPHTDWLGRVWATLATGAAGETDYSQSLEFLRSAQLALPGDPAVVTASVEVARQAVAEGLWDVAYRALIDSGVEAGLDSPAWALWLRTSDEHDRSPAGRVTVNQALRALQSEGGRVAPALCADVEALHERRFEVAAGPGQQVDALLDAWRACRSAPLAERAVIELQRLAESLEAEGRGAEAVTFWEVLAGPPAGLAVEDSTSTWASERIRTLLAPEVAMAQRIGFVGEIREHRPEIEYDWDADVLRFDVPVALIEGEGCLDPGDCPALAAAAELAAHQMAVEIVSLGAELEPTPVDLPIPPLSLEWLTSDTTHAHFRATIPVSTAMAASTAGTEPMTPEGSGIR